MSPLNIILGSHKVFILLGQSNMVGFGRIDPDTTRGTLA